MREKPYMQGWVTLKHLSCYNAAARHSQPRLHGRAPLFALLQALLKVFIRSHASFGASSFIGSYA
jgi:hypothetical protein